MKELLLSAIKIMFAFIGALWGAFFALDTFVSTKVEAGIEEVKEIRRVDMEHLTRELSEIKIMQRETIKILTKDKK